MSDVLRPNSLGPYIELLSFAMAKPDERGRLARRVDATGLGDFRAALRGRDAIWHGSGIGFMRCAATQNSMAQPFIDFFRTMEMAARSSGFAPLTAKQMVAALREMEDNIHRHSERVATGLVAYRCAPGALEFVASDRGIGALQSLRSNPEYAHVTDSGDALQLVISEGVSRLGAGNGFGFRDLFVGLANLNGNLRFRSGSSSLEIHGRNPSQQNATVSQRANTAGFTITVDCLN
ncbi:MAG: hypothetical protein R3C25_09980 [Hyphomonadaceae bacterium]